jgi:hypothetical protein
MNQPNRAQRTAPSVSVLTAMELIQPGQLWERMEKAQQQPLCQTIVVICRQMVTEPNPSKLPGARHEDT